MADKFQIVKDVVPAEDHIRQFETNLKTEGNHRLTGSHHKHTSNGERCFSFDREKQIFNCFHCGAGGSVIDYEANRLDVDIYAAVESLADEYNIDLPNETPEQREKRHQERERRIPVQELITEAFRLYSAELKPHNYFNERAIPEEVIESDLLGYAPPGGNWLASRLEKINPDRDALLGTGLFFEQGNQIKDRYSDRYIFPYWYRGVPVFSIGRSIDPNIESHQKYVKHLVKSDRYPFVNEQAIRHVLWGEDTIRENANVLLVEGIIDAILARHYCGDRYTVISAVTTQPSKAQIERLAMLTTKAKSVLIIADSEENDAGEKGAMQSAENLKRKWSATSKEQPDRFRKQRKKNEDGNIDSVPILPPAKIVRLRREPEVEKRDVADYITENRLDELDYWIDAAQPLEYHRDRLSGNIRRFFEGKTTFIAKRMTDECLLESNYFLYTSSLLHRYKDGVYAPDGADFIREYAKPILAEAWTATRQQALYDWLQDNVDSDLVNADPDTLNLENGLLNIKTMELRPHSPHFLSTVRIPVEYKPNAAWETGKDGNPIINAESGNPKLTEAGRAIQRFITSVVPLDCIDLIYEMIGYCLWAETKFDQAFILYGSGANGKGTLLNLITVLVGKENVATVPVQQLSPEHRFKTAELFGRLANICADLPADPIKDSSTIKMITSGDSLSAERKHQDPFQFRPFAKLLFSANEIPRSRDRTHAYYRRWSFIPFPNRFEGDAKDPHLIDRLTTPENLSALLSLSIDGLKRIWKQGEFTQSQSAEKVKEDFKTDNDNVRAFIEECVEEAYGQIVGRQELYDCYKGYCEAGGYHAFSMQRFNSLFSTHLPNIERRENPRPVHWDGIRLA